MASHWLDAYTDAHAGAYTFTSCVTTADIAGDGDYRLIIADLGTGSYNMKLKVYKGIALAAENNLTDLPTAVLSFFMDQAEPRVAAIALASGPALYIYKNMKPFFKFSVPSETINDVEQGIWRMAMAGDLSDADLADSLKQLTQTVGLSELTAKTQRYIQLTEHQRSPFLDIFKNEPLKRSSVIVAATTIKRNSPQPDAVDTLILCTEHGSIYAVDSEVFSVLQKFHVPAPPVFTVAAGLFDIDYRIVVVCRNMQVYVIKAGMTKPKRSTIDLNAHAVGLSLIGKNIAIGCTNKTLRCYSLKGRQLWSINLPAPINTQTVINCPHRNIQALIVALDNNEVRVYLDNYLASVIEMDGPVTSLHYGRLGREEGGLVMPQKDGSLCVKFLKRNATFEGRMGSHGPPKSQLDKLNIPKKSTVFIDQTVYERSNAPGMHEKFQKDLIMLRLSTARHYLNSLNKVENPILITESEILQLTADLEGFGPKFRLRITLISIGAERSKDLVILIRYNSKLYQLDNSVIRVPYIVPNTELPFETFINAITDAAVSDDVYVVVARENFSGDSAAPLLSASITMPISEPPTVE